jgi:hypothetical protein
MFESTKQNLKDILRKADEGKLQLPDFQRDYVWNDEDVRGLIASIAKGFPVGALLTLETGSAVSFKPRVLAGVTTVNNHPDELLLDGQQRITSLYQSLFCSEPVRTKIRKNTEIERYYYLDIKAALNNGADLFDAVVGVPADRIIRTNFGKDVVLDLSSREREFEHDMFPLNIAFNSKQWFYGWRDYWKMRNRSIDDLERDFDLKVLDRIQHYEMPIIRLDRENSREAICLVFEKVNVGGKKLDAFELLTAIYASDEFDLRKEWMGSQKPQEPGLQDRLVGTDNPRRVLRSIQNTDYLQACTLLHTHDIRSQKAAQGAKGNELPQVTCNRPALLGLPLTAYRKFTHAVESGFIRAAAFLNEQKIISKHDLPYPQQIVTLAAFFAFHKDHPHTVVHKDKLARWFWSGALGELYGSGGETLIARDFVELVAWIHDDGPPPRSVQEAIFQRNRFRSLRGRFSAAYKAIHALMMRHGCRDFVNGDPVDIMTYFQWKIDIHHIFPRDWCKKRNISPRVFNSIVNKTPLSKASNIAIGGVAPSVYLARIEQKHGISSATLDAILRSHLIEPATLRSDDFDAFLEARMNALADLVGKAMDKPVVDQLGTNEPQTETDLDTDDEDESQILAAQADE